MGAVLVVGKLTAPKALWSCPTLPVFGFMFNPDNSKNAVQLNEQHGDSDLLYSTPFCCVLLKTWMLKGEDLVGYFALLNRISNIHVLLCTIVSLSALVNFLTWIPLILIVWSNIEPKTNLLGITLRLCTWRYFSTVYMLHRSWFEIQSETTKQTSRKCWCLLQGRKVSCEGVTDC
jgi:hypothetical protein